MICIDASIAAKWVLTEEFSDAALDLANECLDQGRPLIAPPLIQAEVANTLRQVMIKHAVSLRQVLLLYRGFAMYPISFVAPPRLYEDALQIAERFGLPAAYDSQYVALAQMVGCSLWTADRRLLNALGNRLPFVRWIGDYNPGDPL